MWEEFCKIWKTLGVKLQSNKLALIRHHARKKDPNYIARKRAASLAYYNKKKDENRAKRREFYKDPLIRERERIRRQKYRENPAFVNKIHRYGRSLYNRCRRHSITVDLAIAVYNKQNGGCLFCPIKFPPLPANPYEECPKVIQFDHDHKTGAFRGFLCVGCNTALGNIEKFIECDQLNSAIKYINDHRKDS